MRKAKRVRFDDTETGCVPVVVSSRGEEAFQSPRSDAPRTSEYAYFRKVRNGATTGHSRSLHTENNQLNSSKIKYCHRDDVISSELKSSSKDFRFPFSGAREGPSDRWFSFSPHANGYCESDQIRTKEQTHETGKSPSLLGHNVTPIKQCSPSPPHHEVPKISGNQCTTKGIFAAKRHRLRQWAVQTIFSNSENHHPKGSDLVTSLLNRLFPKGKENDDVSEGDNEKINKSPDSLEKGHHLSCKRDWGNDLPKFYSGRSSEIVPWKWNEFTSGITFPKYGTGSHDQTGDCDQHLMHQRHYDGQHEFSFCIPVERYRSPGCFHFEGLDELNSVIEHSRESPQRLLLEWDFQKGMNGADMTNINHDTARTFAPRLTTSWSPDQPRILDAVCSAGELLSSTLLNHHPEFDSLTTYGSTDFSILESGLKFDDMKYAMAESGPSSMSLPWIPNSLALAEDRDAEDILCKNNSICTYTNQRNKAADEKLYDDLFQKCSLPEDFYLEDSSISHLWRFPQSQRSLYSVSGLMEAPVEQHFNSFSEGTFKNSSLLPNLRSSFDVHINCPLLISHVNQYESDQEVYFVDDNKLEYGYAL